MATILQCSNAHVPSRCHLKAHWKDRANCMFIPRRLDDNEEADRVQLLIDDIEILEVHQGVSKVVETNITLSHGGVVS